MKRKIWQAFVVAGLMLFLSRTAVQRDLQASAFQESRRTSGRGAFTGEWRV